MTFHFRKASRTAFSCSGGRRLGEIDASDLCTDMKSQGNDFDGLRCIGADIG